MTIKTLLKNVPYVQGRVTLSVWADDDEIERVSVESDDRLTVAQIEDAGKGLSRLPIKYLFCTGDGALTIELDGETWTQK